MLNLSEEKLLASCASSIFYTRIASDKAKRLFKRLQQKRSVKLDILLDLPFDCTKEHDTCTGSKIDVYTLCDWKELFWIMLCWYSRIYALNQLVHGISCGTLILLLCIYCHLSCFSVDSSAMWCQTQHAVEWHSGISNFPFAQPWVVDILKEHHVLCRRRLEYMQE